MRRLGQALLVIGAVVFLISLTADLTGLGDNSGFQIGSRQAAGIALGAVLLILGVFALRRGSR